MADISRFSTTRVRAWTYDNSTPRKLTVPASVSCYVYDPTNAVVYSSNEPLATFDSNANIIAYDFFVGPMIFLQPTQPQGTYIVTTVSQMVDGALDGGSELINVS